MIDSEEKVQETEEEVVTSPGEVVKSTRRVISKPAIKTEHPQVVYETKKSIFRTYQLIWYFLGLIEVLLFFRMILKILAANPGSGFALLIYGLSAPLVRPFIGVLRMASTSGGSVFEWPTLLAMVVYWILAYGILNLLQLVKPVTPEEVEETVDNT